MVYNKNYCEFVQMHKFRSVQMYKMMICIFTFD